MPRLTIAALISADTGLGASGCARGSQACSGTRPAFDPNPATVNTNTAIRAPSGTRRQGREPVGRHRPPTTPSARSGWPRTRAGSSPHTTAPPSATSGRVCSASTSTSEASAINSHASRNVVTDAAAGTSSIAATNSGNTASGTRPRCSRRA